MDKITKRNELHLTLHRRFFDEIVKGTKTIEYREIKPYWTKRIEGRRYNVIVFRNGYQPDAPTMVIEYKGYRTDKRNGRYCLKLGRILSLRNYSVPLYAVVWSWDCPVCTENITEDYELDDGDMVTCPNCDTQFTVQYAGGYQI